VRIGESGHEHSPLQIDGLGSLIGAKHFVTSDRDDLSVLDRHSRLDGEVLIHREDLTAGEQ
jgi:hypothetical protein